MPVAVSVDLRLHGPSCTRVETYSLWSGNVFPIYQRLHRSCWACRGILRIESGNLADIAIVGFVEASRLNHTNRGVWDLCKSLGHHET